MVTLSFQKGTLKDGKWTPDKNGTQIAIVDENGSAKVVDIAQPEQLQTIVLKELAKGDLNDYHYVVELVKQADFSYFKEPLEQDLNKDKEFWKKEPDMVACVEEDYKNIIRFFEVLLVEKDELAATSLYRSLDTAVRGKIFYRMQKYGETTLL